MEPKTQYINCFDIYMTLIQERKDWEDEYARNPSPETEFILTDVRDQLRQVQSIIVHRPSPTWN